MQSTASPPPPGDLNLPRGYTMRVRTTLSGERRIELRWRVGPGRRATQFSKRFVDTDAAMRFAWTNPHLPAGAPATYGTDATHGTAPTNPTPPAGPQSPGGAQSTAWAQTRPPVFGLPEDTSVADGFLAWVARQPALRPKSVAIYRRLGQMSNHTLFATLPMSGLAGPDLRRICEEVITQLVAVPYAASTIKEWRKAYSRFFRDLHADGLITGNPWLVVHGPRVIRTAGRRAPTPLEFEMLRMAVAHPGVPVGAGCGLLADPMNAAHRAAVILSLIYLAGLRPNEAAACQWGDVSEHHITVYRSISDRTLDAPKTGRGRRIPISDPLWEDLEAIRPANAQPTDYIMWGAERGRGDWARINDAYLRPAVLRTGIQVCGYELRHGYASLQINAGQSLKDVQIALGHSSEVTTMRYYLHLYETASLSPHVPVEVAVREARRQIWGTTHPWTTQ